MKKITVKKPLMLLVLASSFAGCKGENEEIHDVEYYYKNFDECKKQVEKCQNNPGKLEDTPNCKNAKAAYHKRLIFGDGTGKMPDMEKVMEKAVQEWRGKK
jgi:hypothetical protein